MGMHVCVCVWCMDTDVWVSIYESEKGVRCLSLLVSAYYLERRSLTELEPTILAKLAFEEAPGINLFLLLNTGATGSYNHG